ncbi:hypothetical protein AAFF_G00419960 [Aldrovandia affinis]|uniref:Uncharacterized protein n=1 Tax=Aldrovandia affinis TaxID=143900 RepID=A0AAD7SA78_9TELE|nr:hypothetical protein AAFF_G00419960 [Aldrovandia affinis]
MPSLRTPEPGPGVTECSGATWPVQSSLIHRHSDERPSKPSHKGHLAPESQTRFNHSIPGVFGNPPLSKQHINTAAKG